MGRLASARRYPVKSMGGEDLNVVDFDERGIAGDRWFAVRDADGHFASGKDTRRFRRRDGVFHYLASTKDGSVHVTCGDGTWVVGDPRLDEHLSTSFGLPVTVVPEGEVPHQDMGSVSLIGTATLAWCADRWGIDADPRRLRVNLVIDTDEPFVEESWIGQDVALGTAVIQVVARVPRCRMIDIEQDGVAPRGRWLKPLAQERGMNLAVYADVIRPGRATVGDHLQQSTAN